MQNFDDMTADEIREWVRQQREKSREAFKDAPLPEFSRVKRDDYPHWKVVAYGFHTAAGKRVLIDRGDGQQVEGVLGGVRPTTRGQDVLIVELDGQWGCVRADGSDWAPAENGRVRVPGLTTAVLASPLGQVDAATQAWMLQSNMEGQP